MGSLKHLRRLATGMASLNFNVYRCVLVGAQRSGCLKPGKLFHGVVHRKVTSPHATAALSHLFGCGC